MSILVYEKQRRSVTVPLKMDILTHFLAGFHLLACIETTAMSTIKISLVNPVLRNKIRQLPQQHGH